MRVVRKALRMFEDSRDDERETATFKFQVELERDEVDGGWVATCLDLPGCMSQGETEGEALENLTDAIGGVLAVRMQSHLAEAVKPGTRGDSYRVALSV